MAAWDCRATIHTGVLIQPVLLEGIRRTLLQPMGLPNNEQSGQVLALGPEEGFELAQSENLAALFIVREAHGLQERATDSFKRYRLD